MKKQPSILLVCLALLACSCGSPAEISAPIPIEQTRAPLAAATAAGVVPPGLPGKLLVGLFEDTGATWMTSSGVPWGARYRYFTKGWVNNWGLAEGEHQRRRR